MTKVQNHENRNADIGRQEGRGLPVSREEHFITGQQHQESEDYHAEVRQIGLETGSERQVGDPLGEGGFSEAEVDDADADPALIAAGVDEVDEPVEDGSPGIGDVEVGQE